VTRSATSLDEVLGAELESLGRSWLRRTLPLVKSRAGVHVVVDGHPAIDFCSNDYLGLARDWRVAGAVAAAAATHGTGARSARLLSGNHPLHEALEEALAAFKGTPAALLFASGFLANLGAIPALVGRGDVLYVDALNHASLVDGARLSRSEIRIFPHRDLDELHRLLEADAGRFRRRLIAVDGVFSMDGDLFPLDDLVGLARRYDAWTYVDDAHGTGVLGAGGRGATEHFGVEESIDVVMGTLGKALGSVGAFIAGSRTVVDYLMSRARSFVFTTASPPMLAAAALTALRIATNESWRRDRVRANARRLRAALEGLGWPCGGEPDVPIVPIVVGEAAEAMRLARRLADRGFVVGAIRPPAVPPGTARLRLSLSADHTTDQVDALADALAAALSGNR